MPPGWSQLLRQEGSSSVESNGKRSESSTMFAAVEISHCGDMPRGGMA